MTTTRELRPTHLPVTRDEVAAFVSPELLAQLDEANRPQQVAARAARRARDRARRVAAEAGLPLPDRLP